MAKIGVFFVCLFFCGIICLTTGLPTGAPAAACERPNLMPLHLQGVSTGPEIQAQRNSDMDTNPSPYVVILRNPPPDQKYDASTILNVQVIRNPQYTASTEVFFRGLVLQTRAGDPALPVGRYEFDPNLPENQESVLGYNYLANYQFLQCRRLDNNIINDNSITHTNANDKRVSNIAGPIFPWRPTPNDGLWDVNTGYGPIHAKASIVKDRQTFWVSLQTSFLEFRRPCGEFGNLINGLCVCNVNPNAGWFGQNCEYNCGVSGSMPLCQNGGACGSNIPGQFCTCLPGFSGPFCGTFTPQCGTNEVLVNGVCQCSPGWFGINQDFTPNCIYNCGVSGSMPLCQNGGACGSNTPGQYCTCLSGFFGPFCGTSQCGANQQLQNGVCTCLPGWFGPNNNCIYNCITGVNPPCQNGGTCNPNSVTQNNQQCTCPSNAAGTLCASFIVCPSVQDRQQTTPNTQTAVQWNQPQMIGFANVQPFFFYMANGGPLATTSLPNNQVQAFFDVGTTTVIVQGTDGILDVTCTFDVFITPASPCANFPCQNNGQCFPSGSSGFTCDCSNTGYRGITCNVDDCFTLCPDQINQCSRCAAVNQCIKNPVTGIFIGCSDACVGPVNPCNNGGACFSDNAGGYLCNCVDGWQGSTCLEPVGCNLNPCNALGTCIQTGPTAYICQCTVDFVGTNCEYQNPCRVNLGPDGAANTCNPGICTVVQPYAAYPSSQAFANFVCSCPAGLGGQFCEIVTCNPTCVNGNCVYNTASSATICQCFPGYIGPDCNTLDLCQNVVCQNGGFCEPLNGDAEVVVCNCANTGYMGLQCEIPSCNPPCQNNGVCQVVGGFGTCDCTNIPFTGFTCETPVCTPFCQNGGVCVSVNGQPICQCPTGFTGNVCSIPVCTPVCQNSQCIIGPFGTPICDCPQGYTGPDCSIRDDCLVQTCQNGGTCNTDANGVFDRCILCNPGYSGVYCEIFNPCTPGLHGCVNGECQLTSATTYDCICFDQWFGQFCDQDPNGCDNAPCQNGGICQSQGQNGFTCICIDGYFGTTCIYRDDCIYGDVNGPINCQNGGTCSSEPNTGVFLICVNCNTGYTGRYCENGPTGCNNSPCQNNGICVPNGLNGYTCTCIDGYFGTTCIYRDDCIYGDANGPINCQNGGTCSSEPNTGVFLICVNCNTGYSGRYCEIGPTGCNNSPCQNNGICVPDGQNGFTCTCINGYFGPTCFYRDDCIYGSINCQNDGTCQSEPNTGVFITCQNCNTGYSGRYCEIDICDSSQCVNGICVRTGISTYTCDCFDNYSGQFCTNPLQCNPNPCLNGGVCIPQNVNYRCDCPADYFGRICEDRNACIDSNPCFNGGECQYNPITGAFMTCANCNPGYSGLYCDLYVCDYSFCANGGTCIPRSSSEYSCRCPYGWSGDYCTESTACDSDPCQNGGTCTNTGGGYVCRCTTSWTGPLCTTPRACQPGMPNPCQNGGTCTPTPGSSPDFFCSCTSLWTGEYCQDPLACQDPTLCQNGGVCEYGSTGSFTRCRWPPGYFGTYCELDGCSQDPCGDYGYCEAVQNQDGYRCTCRNGYTGRNCEIPPACGYGFANDPCQPNGICQSSSTSALGYECLCYGGFFGPRCENEDPCYNDPCLNNGRCVSDGFGSYTCECYGGYTGLYCENSPICLNNPCYNGGQCYPDPDISTGLQYRCVCVGPHTGTRCEILTGCHNNPCGNYGRCVSDNSGGYNCECTQGYTGRHCSIEPVCANNPCYNGQCQPSASGNPICICDPGYTGTYCDRPACDDYSCYNGGTCEFDRSNGRTSCRCPVEYQGPQCEIPTFRLCDVNICYNGGTCWDEPEMGSVCTCVQGFGGDLCEHRIIGCDERVCVYGECIEADFARGKTSRCRCNTGWQGEQCDERFQNACSPNPCQNGGACQLFSQYSAIYQCICGKGYTGEICDKRSPISPNSATSVIVSLWTTLIALGVCLIFGRL
ncbi:uncharacterized protein [Amphiura filiformis]|uniref:uncharacterized protein isoform X3 n=1 Tax=Amphiura filiformis TaxID=82378 RepID=UPI003B20E871